MPRVTLDLPEELQSKLKARAEESGHASVEEHIAALIRADIDTDESTGDKTPNSVTVRSDADLEAKLLEGLQSPASEMTSHDWDEMRKRFLDRHSASGSNR
jgi:hypothetical protein